METWASNFAVHLFVSVHLYVFEARRLLSSCNTFFTGLLVGIFLIMNAGVVQTIQS